MIKLTALCCAGLLAAAPTLFAFDLTSTDVKAGAAMAKQQEYNGSGCDGRNLSPELHWTHAPAGTRSFAVTLYDPDAPTGSGWWHWIMFNIPADVHTLRRDAGNPASGLAPKGSMEGRTDFGIRAFGGPCPPRGDKPHRYQFKVYALDIAHIDAAPNSRAAQIDFMLHAHSLGVAKLQATYGR